MAPSRCTRSRRERRWRRSSRAHSPRTSRYPSSPSSGGSRSRGSTARPARRTSASGLPPQFAFSPTKSGASPAPRYAWESSGGGCATRDRAGCGTRAAAARRAVQRGRLAASPRSISPARGIGPMYTLSYGPPLASIEVFADQWREKVDAILALTGARRVILVVPQHGRARRARVPAPLRRGEGARGHHDRHAAPRQRARVTLSRSVPRRRLRPGQRVARGAGPRRARRVACAASRCGPGTTRWSRRRLSARSDGAENVELIGIGHNALLRTMPACSRTRRRADRAGAGGRRRGTAAPLTAARTGPTVRPVVRRACLTSESPA